MRLLVLIFVFLLPLPVLSQEQAGWGNLDQLLITNLSPTGEMAASFWMPDSLDPSVARSALAVIYVHVPGSASGISIHSAIFARTDQGWVAQTPVKGLFGQSPADPAHHPDRIEVTTLTLGPDEPRCCPTQTTRWSISRETGDARLLE